MSFNRVSLKYALMKSDAGAWGSDPTGENDVPVLRSTEINIDGKIRVTEPAKRQLTDSEYQRTRVQVGDLLVVRSSGSDAHLGKVGYADEAAIGYSFSNFVQRLRFKPGTSPRFAWYFLNSLDAKQQIKLLSSTTTGLQNLSAATLGELQMPTPSINEQRRIADFLDAETARIDRLALRRREQIRKLEDLELALIAETLTSGADPRSGNQTGWQWLPAIPRDWSIGPIYGYFSVELGKMLNAERAAGLNQKPYLRNANVHWYQISTDDVATMDFDPDELQRYSVRTGDLLVCEGGAGVAEAAVWDGRIAECYYQKSLHRVRRTDNVPVEWLMYWLRLAKHCGVFESEGNLATIPHLTGEQLRRYRIPIPNDGDALVASLAAGIESLTRTRNHILQGQNLLAERRQALITAAVTGQIDASTASGRGVTEGISS